MNSRVLECLGIAKFGVFKDGILEIHEGDSVYVTDMTISEFRSKSAVSVVAYDDAVVIQFPNGFALSVITLENGLYEAAVKREGKVVFDTPLTPLTIPNITCEDIKELAKHVASLDRTGYDYVPGFKPNPAYDHYTVMRRLFRVIRSL